MERKDIEFIDIGLTTRCNLKCPFCIRTMQDIKKADIDIKILRYLFSLDFPKLNRMVVCGSFGDPILYQHLDELLEIIPKIDIRINTNGSMYQSEWWAELANKLYKRTEINFALDGLRDTHSLHRIGSDFDTVFRNMKSFIKAGGRAIWQFIVFEHNEYQIPEAKRMAADIGSDFTLLMSHKYNDVLRQPISYSKVPANDVLCRAISEKSFAMDYSGEITPCCHTRRDKLDGLLFFKYLKDVKKINLKYSTFDEALKSAFFNYFIDNYKQIGHCQKLCSYFRFDIKENEKT